MHKRSVGWAVGVVVILLVVTVLALAGCVQEPLVDLGPILHVSKAGHDASATGEIDAPFLTIHAAVDAASYGDEVRVSQGTYTEVVTLAGGVAIYGGYSPTDWNARDPAVYTTTIADSRSSGGSAGVPNAAVSANGGSINAVVVLDGFRIEGGGGTYTAGILCVNGASPVISGNTVYGGTGTSGAYGIMCATSGAPQILSNTLNGGGGASTALAYGIYCIGTSPQIQLNDVIGGSATAAGTAAAIYLTGGASPTVRANALDGGAGGVTQAVAVYSGSAPSLVNNVMEGGGGTTYCFGMFVDASAGVQVLHSTIIGGTGAASVVGIGTNGTCDITLINSIVVCSGGTTRLGVIDDGSALTVSYTCFYVPSDGGTNYTAETGCTNVNPVLGGTDGVHLTASTPTTVSQGGITLASVPDDKDGAARTEPYSMGAFERE